MEQFYQERLKNDLSVVSRNYKASFIIHHMKRKIKLLWTKGATC